jgi:tRNA threonylcarbamoyladenosine biosynthesis protein TsaE
MIADSRRSTKTCTAARIVRSRSPGQTQRLGQRLAGTLETPCVVLLCGSLGTGKTTLTRGLAHGLGLQDPGGVHSPSFTIVNIYQGRCPIYHVDLYRLTGNRDLDSVGLDDFLGRDGVTIVEWGERLPSHVDAALIIKLEDAGGESRIIRICEHRAERISKTRRRVK